MLKLNLKDNIFYQIEDEVLDKESIMFDLIRIKEFVGDFIFKLINNQLVMKRGFYFEKIIFDFLEYKGFEFIKTKNTRDFGIDGIIKINLDLVGSVDLGLQIKYKLLGSEDIDLFSSALRNSELQLGLIICKDARYLEKYDLNSKIKAILFSKGIKIKQRLINNKISINPIAILKLEDIISMVADEIRMMIKGIYKK